MWLLWTAVQADPSSLRLFLSPLSLCSLILVNKLYLLFSSVCISSYDVGYMHMEASSVGKCLVLAPRPKSRFPGETSKCHNGNWNELYFWTLQKNVWDLTFYSSPSHCQRAALADLSKVFMQSIIQWNNKVKDRQGVVVTVEAVMWLVLTRD